MPGGKPGGEDPGKEEPRIGEKEEVDHLGKIIGIHGVHFKGKVF